MVEEEKEQGVDSIYSQDSANLMLDVEFNFSVSNPEDNGPASFIRQKVWTSKARGKVNAAAVTSTTCTKRSSRDGPAAPYPSYQKRK
jgi:hypothetical protein